MPQLQNFNSNPQQHYNFPE